VVLDDLPADRQAETRPLGFSVSVSPTPTPVSRTRRLTASPTSGSRTRDVDAGVPLRGDLHRVRHQVDHHLREAIAVARRPWQPAGRREAQLDPSFCSKSPWVACAARSTTSPRSSGAIVPIDAARLDLGQVAHLVDQVGQPLRLGVDDPRAVAHLADRAPRTAARRAQATPASTTSTTTFAHRARTRGWGGQATITSSGGSPPRVGTARVAQAYQGAA
jgi:hypothetical protein